MLEMTDAVTTQLAPAELQENTLVLKFGPDLLAELQGLLDGKHLFDAILIDVTQTGFLFTAEVIIEAAQIAKNLLQMQGAMVFLKLDQAVAIVRDSLTGILSLHIFESHAELFDHSPSLARHIKHALGRSSELVEESTDLSQQVLMTAVPILTTLGIKLKAGLDGSKRRNLVLCSVDSYSQLNALCHRLVDQDRLTMEELMEELRSLEQAKAIYPLFAKIPFLVNCFKNKTPFGLKDYLVAAKLMSQEQVDDLISEQQALPARERINLGSLAVKKGYISGRQLAVAIQDQSFYGQKADSEDVKKVLKRSSDDTSVQALVGHLGNTEASILLQNIAQNRDTGVLSVEYRDLAFKAHYELGKITHAKVGKIEGNKAIIEFCSAWKDGIFVFIKRQPPPDLAKDSCKLTKVVDKLLLDAALARDHADVVIAKLPKGLNSVMEQLPDEKDLLKGPVENLIDPKEEQPITNRELAYMNRVWKVCDGLTPLHQLVQSIGDMVCADACRAVDLLMHFKLINVPESDVNTPLSNFQTLLRKITEKIGKERSSAFLRLALRDTIGYSGRARMYVMSSSAEVGIDMVAAKATGTSLSTVVKDLENWQVKYIEYVSQELDSNILLNIIREIHPNP